MDITRNYGFRIGGSNPPRPTKNHFVTLSSVEIIFFEDGAIIDEK